MTDNTIKPTEQQYRNAILAIEKESTFFNLLKEYRRDNLTIRQIEKAFKLYNKITKQHEESIQETRDLRKKCRKSIILNRVQHSIKYHNKYMNSIVRQQDLQKEILKFNSCDYIQSL